jgi:hypothetical protein
MSLDSIVNVQISTQTTAPEQANFGTPLVVGYHTEWPERTRVFAAATAVADLITAGFDAVDPIVVAVGKILSQSPKVTEVVIGRMAESPVRTIKLTPQLAELEAGVAVNFVVNGQAVSATAASPTVAELTADMKTNIDALSIPGVTTTDNSTDLDITASVGVEVTVEMPRRQIERKDNTADTGSGIVADLVAISNENDDWYGLIVAQESEAITNAVAAHIETLKKVYAAVTGDDEVLDSVVTTDIMSDLAGSNYARTRIFYHPKPHLYVNAADLGDELPLNPGSYTRKFKTLAGVEVVTMTNTEKTNVNNKRGNTYTATAGISIVEEGIVSAAGEFADIPRFIDWLSARMQERIYARLINLDKLPFTDAGIGVIEAEIRGQLQDGIDPPFGGLAADPAPTVTVPKAADVSFVDKAARTLTGVSFEATLSGAIHELTINGVVTV